MAKEYFKTNNIEFTAIDVTSDPTKAQEMVEKSGQMGVPVIMIDDKVIVGFDKKRLDEELGLT